MLGLALGDFGAELEDARGEVVLGGEGGGVEVEDGLVLALVEGVVNVDELWWWWLVLVGCWYWFRGGEGKRLTAFC